MVGNSGMKLEEIRDAVPWYASKLGIRTYLQELNREEKVNRGTLAKPQLT